MDEDFEPVVAVLGGNFLLSYLFIQWLCPQLHSWQAFAVSLPLVLLLAGVELVIYVAAERWMDNERKGKQ